MPLVTILQGTLLLITSARRYASSTARLWNSGQATSPTFSTSTILRAQRASGALVREPAGASRTGRLQTSVWALSIAPAVVQMATVHGRQTPGAPAQAIRVTGASRKADGAIIRHLRRATAGCTMAIKRPARTTAARGIQQNGRIALFPGRSIRHAGTIHHNPAVKQPSVA